MKFQPGSVFKRQESGCTGWSFRVWAVCDNGQRALLADEAFDLPNKVEAKREMLAFCHRMNAD